MSDTPETDRYVKMRASLAYCIDRDATDFARRLERERDEAIKQKNILMSAMEEIGGGANSWKSCVDVIAPRAIAEATGQSLKEVVKKLTGLEGASNE